MLVSENSLIRPHVLGVSLASDPCETPRRQNLDFKGAAPLCKKFEVALVILITEKGGLSSISTLSDVMGKTWCDDAS
jgi:hypothetical protein